MAPFFVRFWNRRQRWKFRSTFEKCKENICSRWQAAKPFFHSTSECGNYMRRIMINNLIRYLFHVEWVSHSDKSAGRVTRGALRFPFVAFELKDCVRCKCWWNRKGKGNILGEETKAARASEVQKHSSHHHREEKSFQHHLREPKRAFHFPSRSLLIGNPSTCTSWHGKLSLTTRIIDPKRLLQLFANFKTVRSETSSLGVFFPHHWDDVKERKKT